MNKNRMLFIIGGVVLLIGTLLFSGRAKAGEVGEVTIDRPAGSGGLPFGLDALFGSQDNTIDAVIAGPITGGGGDRGGGGGGGIVSEDGPVATSDPVPPPITNIGPGPTSLGIESLLK